MKILALESSSERASVALSIDGDIRERVLVGHANHSEHLLAAIRDLLAAAGLGSSALDAVAFGSGPGAFTGLRLSCGVAQGLALGAGLGVIPVSSLAALALFAPHHQVLVATDARMGEVYHARYRVENGTVTELAPPACSPPPAVPAAGPDYWGLGSAFAAYVTELAAVRAGLVGCDPLAAPTAGNVARLAAQAGSAACLPAEGAFPLYVRDKVALTTAERLARGNKA
ncbi:tRNA (adenosine(37)-N6)-threonylcarbamoyltransferase complex dimerization subunit type 1 TsaB [Betaproteobacteria bacterium]|nr:tRNA (adenosine(37)-N6)-threonylcarbamoyltransferase complex dimerization subunit type 1 TsaB [Betaproteobacteria bacterium]GHT98903.1 tRNA (adenosine(37)-N6)-threonylcarbamoyltransferase complex dimerization subunit type 1 TsaB [Betaproteobacteria bacterium]GHU27720.1 tRNA (adenosine(37)-N6)-threonylcarbamoyltransferase complex dimerization subunit type 1 TsaB [Betaproteobacteria bacterium]